uniref:Product n=1 Tax=Brugia timori TaxID=42155 RepID=A0A0R3QGY8_9BILA
LFDALVKIAIQVLNNFDSFFSSIFFLYECNRHLDKNFFLWLKICISIFYFTAIFHIYIYIFRDV